MNDAQIGLIAFVFAVVGLWIVGGLIERVI
jgi:hypothetical protein